ncbi:TPA: serine protease, partial [Staphylococcus aureus]|nr:serine protease [Staphylococcus aureus]HDP4446936.1 serine protease [Staphylococcus aureus]
MTTILESTAGDTWVEQVSNIIVQPIFTLILTCLTFLGFVYQLYSKK